jgi:superfamily II DNA or RNA helicase
MARGPAPSIRKLLDRADIGGMASSTKNARAVGMPSSVAGERPSRSPGTTKHSRGIRVALFIHGGFAGEHFLLWGESAPERAVVPPKRRGRRPKKVAPPHYPFDSGADALARALAEAGMAMPNARPDQMVLRLPSIDGRPLASSPLVEEPPPSNDAPTITPWTSSALRLPAGAAVEILCGCVGKRTLGPGIFATADLAYWVQALRYAGALVARGKVLPDLDDSDGLYRARWKPLPGGSDVSAEARLVEAMPDACRAACLDDGEPPPSRSTVLRGFVDWVVDALMRNPRAGDLADDDTVDGRWLAALRGPEDRVDGTAEELARLARRAREWRRPVSVAFGGPFRLCFRLEEPAVDKDDDSPLASIEKVWTIRYLLQSVSDPSLLVSAPEAWRTKEKAATPFIGGGIEIKEFILISLGRAARLCPFVAESLRATLPEGHETDAAGAVSFLTDHARTLEQAGFAVMLPAWWTRRGTKVRLAAHAKVKTPKMQGGGGLSLEQMVRFDWQVALGDHSLTRGELLALARLKVPLVRVRGQWVLLDGKEIEEAIALLGQKGEEMTARDAVRMALGGGEAGSVGLAGVVAEGWIAELLSRLSDRDRIEEPNPPEGLDGSLRPYQSRGFAWLRFLARWGLGACLADDMGLGKTIQTLVLIQHDKETRAGNGCVLLVCPTSVIGNWQHEAARFTPGLSVIVHHGTDRAKGATLRRVVTKNDLLVTSYSLLQRDIEALRKVSWRGVVLDEAQNVKNPETKQAKAARGLEAGYRVALTGTPVENNVGDLWSIMEFLNPGLLGTQAAFKRTFFVPIQASRDETAMARLKSLTGPFLLRRLKTDRSIISDLPEKMEMKVYCTLTREQASLYAAVVEEAVEALESSDGIRRKGVVLATLSKLKQVCNHPAQFLGDNSAIPDRSGKLARLVEMLEEILETGERALIFTQFAEMGEIIRNHLQETFGDEVPFLHGGVAKAKRDRMVARFQEDGGSSVFLLSLKAGGTGLNLTNASHVFHFDRWWNPAVEDQATDRVFRIGQTRRVQVHKFLCAGTLEESIDDMIERKKAVASAVVGTGETWLTELSTKELRDVIALREDAFGV